MLPIHFAKDAKWMGHPAVAVRQRETGVNREVHATVGQEASATIS
jgi:hypothetical protein